MDPKALAKAKRFHSQHGRKNHPTPSAVAQKKKAAHERSEEKVQRLQSYDLPSNRDRYEDVEEEVESSSSITSAEGEVVRKSKGADFAYLIEQAKSKQGELRTSTVPKSSSLFEDIPLDFMQGFSSMCVERGKNLLSRCNNDNFFVDEDLTSNYEVPFLTLNLHALAAQLSKIKLSDRLFIEEGLLPEDLCSDDPKDTSTQSERLEATEVCHNLNPPASFPSSSPAVDAIGQAKDRSTSAISDPDVPQTSKAQNTMLETAKEFAPFLSQVSSAKSASAEALESIVDTRLSNSKQPASSISSDQKLPAEADLDLLLDSSGGSIRDSTLENRSFSGAPNHSIPYPIHQISRDRVPVASRKAAIDSLDASLDDLLQETSTTKGFQRHTSGIESISIRNIPHHSNSDSIDDHVASKGHSPSLDDFDSWFDTLE